MLDKDIDLLINPPAITSKAKDEYYKSLSLEEIIENNYSAVRQAVEAPANMTLEEYYDSLKQPWHE